MNMNMDMNMNMSVNVSVNTNMNMSRNIKDEGNHEREREYAQEDEDGGNMNSCAKMNCDNVLESKMGEPVPHFRSCQEVSNGQSRCPSRVQNGLRSIPGHFPTTTVPWGRRQWAQAPSNNALVCCSPLGRTRLSALAGLR